MMKTKKEKLISEILGLLKELQEEESRIEGIKERGKFILLNPLNKK